MLQPIKLFSPQPPLSESCVLPDGIHYKHGHVLVCCALSIRKKQSKIPDYINPNFSGEKIIFLATRF